MKNFLSNREFLFFAFLLFIGTILPVENEALPRGNEAFQVENMALLRWNEVFPVKNEPFPVRNKVFAVEDAAFPVGTKAFPDRNEAFGLKKGKRIEKYERENQITTLFKKGRTELWHVFPIEKQK